MPRRAPAPPDLNVLLDSWELALRAERKSPQTVDFYRDGVLSFLRWCAEEGRPARLDRPSVNGFVAALLERGAQPATARSRQLALRRFCAWLLEEGEIDEDPLVGLKAPKLDSRIVQPLTDVQLRALIEACRGREMRDRRDEAIIPAVHPRAGIRPGSGGGSGAEPRELLSSCSLPNTLPGAVMHSWPACPRHCPAAGNMICISWPKNLRLRFRTAD